LDSNARNDEIHENLERMRREREAYEDSLAIVRQWNAAKVLLFVANTRGLR